MTAVDYLIEQLKQHGWTREFPAHELFDRAKAWEKQQITDAYKFGLSDEYVVGSDNYYHSRYGSQASHETFKK